MLTESYTGPACVARIECRNPPSTTHHLVAKLCLTARVELCRCIADTGGRYDSLYASTHIYWHATYHRSLGGKEDSDLMLIDFGTTNL